MDRTDSDALHAQTTETSDAAMDSVREQLAANLRRLRERAGISQEALASICDLHRSEISVLECCKRSPRLETIVILSRGLELASPAELLEGISTGG